MVFPPQFLDELRARLPLNEVIGRRVRLSRQGHEYKGLCPFHNEKTPSFTINEDKGFFHCFGCGAHGDIFGFVMQAEGLQFVEAVERLAGECGLELPARTPESRARAERVGNLYELNQAAAEWFRRRLLGDEGAAARTYLRTRGLDDEMSERFRLGFAPDGQGRLRSYFHGEGVDESLLLEAGLIRTPDDHRAPYDFFRHRVIFPIADGRDRVIAFGGRALGEGRPKYLNTPETDLFHKGRTLYNLAAARGAAREAGTVIVAEGYLDVIALARAGFENAVAPLGTALTEAQIEQLWRLAGEPLLCLDGDDAGRRAAARAAERALPMLRAGRSLRFAFLPAGEDPDSLLARHGAPALAAALARPMSLVDFLWTLEVERGPVDTPERRAGLRKHLDQRIAQIADRAVRDEYMYELRNRFRASFAAPARKRHGRRAAGERRPEPISLRGHARGHGAKGDPGHRERVLVATLITHPELLAVVRREFADLGLTSPVLDRLRRVLLDISADEPHIDFKLLRQRLAEQGHDEAIDRLLQPKDWNLRLSERFVRPDADRDDALDGWRDILGLHCRQAPGGGLAGSWTP